MHFGVYGTSALTLITAQNTIGVREVHLLQPELVAKQIEAVAEDFEVRAAKTGALGSEELIEAVAAGIDAYLTAVDSQEGGACSPATKGH